MTTHHEIRATCHRAAHALAELSHLPTAARAAILDSIAASLDARRDDILSTCAEETALTIDELTPEFARMTGTLRMFANLIREGSWVRAAIDTHYEPSAPAEDERSHPSQPQPSFARAKGSYQPIGPNHDLRKMLVPLGPVAVFGASNFPLAYGVCGGDTASALAAGCPVIVKEHPAHPRTGRLLTVISQEAIHDSVADFIRTARYDGEAEIFARKAQDWCFDDTNARNTLDKQTESLRSLAHLLAYVHNEISTDFTIAEDLVKARSITAVGFTGSTSGGMALHKLAQQRRYPIPVFAEMGSLNTVFVSANSYARRGQAIADEIAASVLARVGQQCTKPGVVFIHGNNEHWGLHRMVCARLFASPPRRMLSRSVADNYYRRLDIIAQSNGILETTPLPTPDQREAMLGVPVVIAAGDIAMEDAPEVWEEIFGPAIIIASHNDSAEYQLDGRLGMSIYGEPDDFTDYVVGEDQERRRAWGDFSKRFPLFARCAGRIIFNGPPTGVRVATAMVHGGPFPATNRPETTAVGPLAIERWCRPICFQNAPDALLPQDLQNANPLGIWRAVNGQLSKSPIA